MSEYQYHEFQAIDRPLSDADRQALRGLSTRARITATSFTNEHQDGTLAAFPDRVRSLRVRHSRKPRFIERLQQVDLQ